MNGRYVQSERLVALFLFAILLFNPPLLLIFDSDSTVLGFPSLYLYLFVVWGVLIVLLALIIETSDGPQNEADLSSGTESDIGAVQRAEGREP